MACVDTTNFDHELALSMSRCCPTEDWDECFKPCTGSTSRSSWEGSGAACSAACAATLSSSALPYMDLAAREKICYGDWVDDRTTEASASPRSDLSLCDEAAENEPAEAQYELAQSEPAKRHISWGDFSDSDDSAPKDEKQASGWADFVDSARVDEARKESGLSWADLEDTGSEDEPAQEKVDFKQERRWSDLVDSASDDEFASRNVEEQAEEADQLPSLATDASMELADSSEVNPARSTRSSRRSRAAHARAAAADDCGSTAGARR